MKPITTDTYDLEKLLGDGYVYVDKTADILKLINKSIESQFFYAQPRWVHRRDTLSR